MLLESDVPSIMEYHTVDFSLEEAPRLPATFEVLSSFRVGIVGLGSVGSKIAVSLARAGVRNFLLIDDDVLKPGNLVRNELNWLDVGTAKVEAVARAVKRVAVAVEIATHRVSVDGQENPQLAGQVADAIATCDLVIDATANSNAFPALAALCKRDDIGMVWGEIFAAGAGATMARSRPRIDAEPLSVRTHVHGVLATMSPLPGHSEQDYEHVSDDVVHIASDSDVSALAASMTQFALDTLCSPEDSLFR